MRLSSVASYAPFPLSEQEAVGDVGVAVAGCCDAAGAVDSGVGVGVAAGGSAAVGVLVRVLVGMLGGVFVLVGYMGMYSVGVRELVGVIDGVGETVQLLVGECLIVDVLLGLLVGCREAFSVVRSASRAIPTAAVVSAAVGTKLAADSSVV
jgi:hypothetical protein